MMVAFQDFNHGDTESRSLFPLFHSVFQYLRGLLLFFGWRLLFPYQKMSFKSFFSHCPDVLCQERSLRALWLIVLLIARGLLENQKINAEGAKDHPCS
jgi:hypothetical protein